ncbi:FAD:protein FMN transferase [Clostridium aminobutyricum]|uniref:FAD:protein FMN transferase n=1 Tax=Clostridium aminobutyricum TaxID=33953 RepID=A0A939D9F2_CLOAM|nr:FAD:protein FMN transferase [Clostridium aminobutyricum]MBN7773198.1 FAD:protein FMN transferase [Clostridium aminobutyricum]
MKNHKLKVIALLLCTALIITQTACGEKQMEPVSDTGFYLNTSCTISIYDKSTDEAKDLISKSFALCEEYEGILSKTIEGSDIYKINHAKGEPVEVQEETLEVIKKSIDYGALSEGKFDITVGKLSGLWNFTGENPRVPAAADIDTAKATIDYRQINIEDNKVSLDNPETELDLGGIAKGYIADKVSEYLVGQGVESAIVNLGGNIVAIGEKTSGDAWNIGIEKPYSDRSDIVGSVKVKNKTVVTSGIYERYFEQDGINYHHILDVKTGYPAQTDVEAVSIVGDFGKSADCDALTTICLILGVEKGMALVESLDGIEASFVDTNGEVHYTSGMEFIPVE